MKPQVIIDSPDGFAMGTKITTKDGIEIKGVQKATIEIAAGGLNTATIEMNAVAILAGVMDVQFMTDMQGDLEALREDIKWGRGHKRIDTIAELLAAAVVKATAPKEYFQGRTLSQWCATFNCSEQHEAEARIINDSDPNGLRVFPDGDRWMCIDQQYDNLQNSRVEFANTPEEARQEWITYHDTKGEQEAMEVLSAVIEAQEGAGRAVTGVRQWVVEHDKSRDAGLLVAREGGILTHIQLPKHWIGKTVCVVDREAPEMIIMQYRAPEDRPKHQAESDFEQALNAIKDGLGVLKAKLEPERPEKPTSSIPPMPKTIVELFKVAGIPAPEGAKIYVIETEARTQALDGVIRTEGWSQAYRWFAVQDDGTTTELLEAGKKGPEIINLQWTNTERFYNKHGWKDIGKSAITSMFTRLPEVLQFWTELRWVYIGERHKESEEAAPKKEAQVLWPPTMCGATLEERVRRLEAASAKR
jgi:hypothetical protein